MKTLITNATALIDGKFNKNASVLISDGKIVNKNFIGDAPLDAKIIDANGDYLIPSFIEIHAHGGGGADFADLTKDSFDKIMDTHLLHGVTKLCPTLVASSWEKTIKFLKFCEDYCKYHPMFGGVHLEGPFLSPIMCGAQNLSNIIKPTRSMVDELCEFSDIISSITVAPEIEGVEYLANKMIKKGVSLSVGHSNADAYAMKKASDLGFNRVTHLFSSTSRRAKQGSYVIGGIEECALIDDNFTVELIGDGHHVSRESFLLTQKCKGIDKVVLVSDAMRGAGCKGITESYLGEIVPENKVIIEDGVAKLPDRSSFAGSVAVGDDIIKALCGRYEISLETISNMISVVPAKLLSLKNRGAIENGYDAELVLMDNNYSTVRVFSNFIEKRR